MIGTEGAYLFDCQIQNLRDFVQYDDTFFFRVCEFAGGILPEFEMTFTTSEDQVHKYLHEGTLIRAKLGRTRDKLNDVSLYCTSWSSSQYGSNYTAFNVKGFVVPVDYVNSPVLKNYQSMSAVAAVLECARSVFGTNRVKSNVTTSLDSQNWYQPNITNKNFINKTIYRADLGSSFPAIAITIDGNFILKDIGKDLKDKTTKWSFVNAKRNPNDATEVPYIGDANASSNNGIVNKIIGSGFDFSSMVMETEAVISEVFRRKSSVLAQANTVGGSATSNPKKVIGVQQNENVHANYNRSYNYNLTSLLNLSCLEVPFTVDGVYYDIRVLDKAKFFRSGKVVKDSVSDKVNVFSDEYNSGVYYVTAVVRQIENKKFTTNVKLSRESVNEVR